MTCAIVLTMVIVTLPDLIVLLPNDLRVREAIDAYRRYQTRDVSAEVAWQFLEPAWDHDHDQLLRTAATDGELFPDLFILEMFESLGPRALHLSETLTIWRGGSAER